LIRLAKTETADNPRVKLHLSDLHRRLLQTTKRQTQRRPVRETTIVEDVSLRQEARKEAIGKEEMRTDRA
jgi:hypothetical protein